MDISAYILCFLTFLLSLEKVYGLECYACTNQDSNKDKCIKTTKQCDEGMDACLTWVRWGIPPYWTPHGDRIYFISKSCSTINECSTLQKNTMSFCKRDWYADWGCYECCAGDLCNYYVTLDGNRAQSHLSVLFLSTVAALFCTWKFAS